MPQVDIKACYLWCVITRVEPAATDATAKPASHVWLWNAASDGDLAASPAGTT